MTECIVVVCWIFFIAFCIVIYMGMSVVRWMIGVHLHCLSVFCCMWGKDARKTPSLGSNNGLRSLLIEGRMWHILQE